MTQILAGADSAGVNFYSPPGAGPQVVVATKFTAIATGVATSMTARIQLAAGFNYRLAVYDALGTTRLSDTVAFLDTAAPGLITANLTSSPIITAGVDYVLAAFSDGNGVWIGADASGFLDGITDATYPTWPGNANGSTFAGNGKIAIMVNGNPAGATVAWFKA